MATRGAFAAAALPGAAPSTKSAPVDSAAAVAEHGRVEGAGVPARTSTTGDKASAFDAPRRARPQRRRNASARVTAPGAASTVAPATLHASAATRGNDAGASLASTPRPRTPRGAAT